MKTPGSVKGDSAGKTGYGTSPGVSKNFPFDPPFLTRSAELHPTGEENHKDLMDGGGGPTGSAESGPEALTGLSG
mgnify:CR=1 FL=1